MQRQETGIRDNEDSIRSILSHDARASIRHIRKQREARRNGAEPCGCQICRAGLAALVEEAPGKRTPAQVDKDKRVDPERADSPPPDYGRYYEYR